MFFSYMPERRQIFVHEHHWVISALMPESRGLGTWWPRNGWPSYIAGPNSVEAKAHLKQHHFKFQPGLNEDLVAPSLWGI